MKTTVKKLLQHAKLYCVSMPPTPGQSYLRMVEQACRGGADIVQLRDKKLSARDIVELGKKLQAICKKHGTIFVLNDRLDAALACGADGVHLGQDDLSLPAARAIANAYLKKIKRDPSEFLIGVSTHSLAQALKAQKEKADYLGCGPVFSTPTKPDYQAVGLKLVAQYRKHIHIPFVAIGGIDAGNISEVLKAGASCVAVVRAAFGQKNICNSVKKLKLQLTNPPKNL